MKRVRRGDNLVKFVKYYFIKISSFVNFCQQLLVRFGSSLPIFAVAFSTSGNPRETFRPLSTRTYSQLLYIYIFYLYTTYKYSLKDNRKVPKV